MERVQTCFITGDELRFKMQVERFRLFRQDIRDLVELTVQKMDLYHMVGQGFANLDGVVGLIPFIVPTAFLSPVSQGWAQAHFHTHFNAEIRSLVSASLRWQARCSSAWSASTILRASLLSLHQPSCRWHTTSHRHLQLVGFWLITGSFGPKVTLICCFHWSKPWGLCAGVPVDGHLAVHARLDQVAQLCHSLAHQGRGCGGWSQIFQEGSQKRHVVPECFFCLGRLWFDMTW